MVNRDFLPRTMGQAALCSVTAPQTDTLSPDGMSGSVDGSSNGIPDLMSILSLILDNKIDIRAEDLVNKLRVLVEENYKLKDTINQNNLAMKQQMSLLVQWSEQVESQQSFLRNEIDQSNKRANSLQQENSVLKSTILNFKTSDGSSLKFNELDNTIQSLNEELSSNDRKLYQAREDKEVFLQQRAKIEGELTLLKGDLSGTKSQCERLDEQRRELVNTVRQLRSQLQSHRETSGLFTNEDESRKEELRQVGFQLQETRNQLEYMESELAQSREEIVLYKAKCKAAEEIQSKVTTSKEGNPELQRAREKSDLLREEICALELKLNTERERLAEERQTAAKLREDHSKLKSVSHDEYYCRDKLKSAQEQCDEATAKTICYEELVSAKNEDISRLKKDIGHVKAELSERASEGDTIAVLRAQVEVYQNDFRAEREAREAMATDRERMRDEVRHLIARNAQLTDEIDTYQRSQFRAGPTRSTGSDVDAGSATVVPLATHGNNAPSAQAIWEKLSLGSNDKKDGKPESNSKPEEPAEVDENLFYCPKCNISFAELRPLEEHVNRCLDED